MPRFQKYEKNLENWIFLKSTLLLAYSNISFRQNILNFYPVNIAYTTIILDNRCSLGSSSHYSCKFFSNEHKYSYHERIKHFSKSIMFLSYCSESESKTSHFILLYDDESLRLRYALN